MAFELRLVPVKLANMLRAVAHACGAALPAGPRTALLLAAYVFSASHSASAADLPVGCNAGACAGGPSVWVTSGNATATVTGPQLNIRQTTDKAILNWAEFNVGAGNSVNFQQPDANSLAINRIFQESPSQIFGKLTANGQIYLINRNGILFGQGAQVNVRGLVASSLDIAEEAAQNGILSPQLLPFQRAAFEGDGRVHVLDAEGNVVTDANGDPIAVKVSVEQGATLTAKSGGRIALFGQRVENAGKIETPDGQAVLAAGQKVYLKASSDPDLRGLLVEVDAGGQAWNKATGDISSARGNVSLVGLAINQDGRVSATTSVRSNGSIRLLARDSVEVRPGATSGSVVVDTTQAGAVSFGGASRTEVTPDATDTALAVDEQTQARSSVEVMGRDITLAAGSEIRVPGGDVSLTALPDPTAAPTASEPLPFDPATRIRLEAGSRIDVAGSVADVSIKRNLVEVELRSNELKDAPVQRDGPLRGATIVVDARTGTPLADVAGTVSAALRRDVRERTSTGGNVTLNSQGSVAVESGAQIDVSGGAVRYTGGVMATSKLVRKDGSLVDIANADPNETYRGVFNPTVTVTSRKWGASRTTSSSIIGSYEAGYVEGKSAGSVTIAAPQMLVNGSLSGRALNGIRQRDSASRARGGRLVIGLADGQGIDDFRAPSVTFVDDIVAGDEPVQDRLWLATDYMSEGGFAATEIYSNGVIEVPAATPLVLAGGSSLLLNGGAVDINGSITAPSGDVRIGSVVVNTAVSRLGERRGGVIIADGVAIDTSGGWINDTATLATGGTPSAPLWIDGGRINLSVDVGGELVLGDSVKLAADAGAALSAAGSLDYGDAGAISLLARSVDAALQTGTGLQLSAYGFGRGGSLTLGANQLVVGGATPAAQRSDPSQSGTTPYRIGTDFFERGGFQSYNLIATGGRLVTGDVTVEPLTVEAGAVIEPRVASRTLAGGYSLRPTGAALETFTSAVELPAAERQGASLRLAVEPHSQVTQSDAGNLLLTAGSRIALDPGGSVTLQGTRQIEINGTISVPAGVIRALLTTQSSDPGYDPVVGITVGATGQLLAGGATRLVPNDAGLREGEVLDGGSISLTANRGSIDLRAGSVVDVSGETTVLDLPRSSGPGFAATEVASRGGAISLLAVEGLALSGSLRGASGGSGTVRPEGGTLAIGISRVRGFNDGSQLPTFPTTPRQLVLGGEVPAEGDPNGTARIDAAAVLAGGFDNLTLQADDAIVFAENLDFAIANRLQLQSHNVSAGEGVTEVKLAANSIALGPRLIDLASTAASATGGTATLEARAGVIDLFGDLSLQGFSTTTLDAASAIRFSGTPRSSPGPLTGSLSVAGTLNLRAAQVHPTTYTDFTVSVAPDDGGRLNIYGTGSVPETPLSGAGRLTVRAADILQSGVVRAPLGQISLRATNSLTLAAGSVTSTAADGKLIPFGKVIAGSDWYYQSSSQAQAVDALPGQSIELDGNAVLLQEGSVVDVRGGGDLYAYEFIPGPGGSVDALAPEVNPNLFAILPGSELPFAPFDTQEYASTSLRPGDSVHLEGVPGLLSEGTYALLPARYALLPGAVLVEAIPGSTDVAALTRLPDGTAVSAGYRTVEGTGLRDSRTRGFAVRSGSWARQLAEYRDSRANEFFAPPPSASNTAAVAAARLPRDSGDLRIVVGETLELASELRATPGTGGRGARMDISADNLEIVTTSGGAAEGVVQVEAGALQALGAASLLLGGTSDFGARGATLTPQAATVSLAAGTTLAGPEILLIARDAITLGEGAQLTSEGAAVTGAAPETLQIAGSAGGALLRVSRGVQANIERDEGAAAAGDIRIGTGAVVGASGAIAVDAGGVVRSFGSVDIDGGALSLASRRIALGIEQQSDADGALHLSDATLATLASARELRFAATETLEIAGPVTIGAGAQRPQTLILDAPLLLGTNSPASFSASNIVLGNSSFAASVTPTQGVGSLALSADRVQLTSGNVAIDGFASLSIDAGRVETLGELTLVSGADLAIDTAALSGAAGSSLEVRAAGRAVTLTGGNAAQPGGTAGLGAALDVEAGSIVADTRLIFPSGRVRLAADETLTLGADSRVDVSGSRRTLGPAAVSAPGGDVILVARNGDLTQAAGSVVDVSAGNGSASAGTIAVYAGGTAALAGSLRGEGADAARSGAVRFYAAGGTDFSVLNNALNGGGFARSRYIELGAGDIDVTAGTTVRALDVTLAASGGAVTVDGTIDASGAADGRVVLAARDNVSLGASAQIDARTTAAAGNGGQVSLVSSEGTLSLAAGAALDVSGPAGADTGTVLLRAQAVGGDMGIAELSADIDGASQVILEPVVRATVGSTIDSSTIASLRTLVTDYMTAAAATIRARLGLDAERDVIRAGLEVSAPGDVTLASEWDLRDWRFDGQPGFLTLRAQGNINLNADLSDGFVRGGSVANPTLTQLDAPTWSYRLVAGAATNSALSSATAGRLIDSRGIGSITLANNRVVRTGTGSIALAADADIVLAGRGSTIYTAGVPTREPNTIGGIRGAWMRDGGDITLAAGRDVTAAASAQIMSGWTMRTVTPTGAEWAVDFLRFAQGVAAMAGGNVDVTAGRDIRNLSASVLTTGAPSTTQPGTIDVWGGGDIAVKAGRDVLSGVFSTWKGAGSLTAGRSIVSGSTSGTLVHTILSFGEGRFDVVARDELQLEGVINPTTVLPANGNLQRAYFYTYAPSDSLSLLGLGGDVSLINNAAAFTQVVGSAVSGLTSTRTFGVYPGTLRVAALSGNLDISGNTRLLPAPGGQLELLAGRSIIAAAGQDLLMSDAAVALVPLAANAVTSAANTILPAEFTPRNAIHVGDSQPALLVAAGGDIDGGSYRLAKHFEARATGDIRNVTLVGQNTAADQVSLVQAGGDISLPDANNGIELGGPGQLSVLAGGDLDLGFSLGIVTLGNTVAPTLPDGGADIDIWTGLTGTPDFEAFNERYVEDLYEEDLDEFADVLVPYVEALDSDELDRDSVWAAWAELSAEQQAGFTAALAPEQKIRFESFVDLVAALVSGIEQVTGESVTASAANDAYLELGSELQRPLLDRFFFRELRDSGREANLGTAAEFERGREAVDLLFPDAVDWLGDLDLVFSRIYTLEGGDINLFAPGGLLNVGLATLPATGAQKQPSQLGIVAQGEGDVRIFTDGDVLVNQSRVFTLQGGDIMIWSDNGNIDAGRGSKAAISAPPPTITVTPTGQVTVEFSDAIAGSGIRGILVQEDLEPGDVDLVAPTGEVNAGDAGIGSAGNLNIAAPQVVGLDNIQVGGVSTGVPAETGGLAASLTGVSNVAASAADSAESAASGAGDAQASLADAALGWLDVFVEGFGDPGAGDDDEEERRRRRLR